MTKLITTHFMPANTGLAFFPGIILFGKGASPSLIAHELRHKEQQTRDGWFKWTLRYAFNISARLEYEAEAYAVSAYHKCVAQNWQYAVEPIIENEAYNLRYYNAWMFWKPSIELAVERITHYFNIEKSKSPLSK